VNPELQRNLWLEFSLHRLVAMPAVAGADVLGALVLPPLFERPAFANVVLAVHAAIALGLVVYRWRQNFTV